MLIFVLARLSCCEYDCLWFLEKLLLVKVSFEPHHFPRENDPEAIGFDPLSHLTMCTLDSPDLFMLIMRNPEVSLSTNIAHAT